MSTDSPEPQPERRRRWWPVLFCVSPILAGIVLVLVIKPPAVPGAGNAGPTPAQLDGKGRALDVAPADLPGDSGEEPVPGTGEGPDAHEESAPAPAKPDATAREVDIYLVQLAHAARVGDQRGMAEAHTLLDGCLPDALVDERVQAALTVDPNAWVRIEFFKAFQGNEAAVAWSVSALRRRTDVLTGAVEVTDQGEREELKLYILYALELLQKPGEKPDPELMALVTTVMQAEKPDWVLLEFLQVVAGLGSGWEPGSPLCRALEPDLRALLLRGSATEPIREIAFLCWFGCQPRDMASIQALGQPPFDSYLPVLLGCFPKYPWHRGTPTPVLRAGAQRPHHQQVGWLFHPNWSKNAQEEVARVCSAVLAGTASTEQKKKLIDALATHIFEHDERVLNRELLEEGLARKDANYADYLAAIGSTSASREDMELLSKATGDADPAIAAGAVEGLRRSQMPQADAELTRILEQGSNPGLKGQVLGALLDRAMTPQDKTALLDKYLAPEHDASLRAVAVAFVPDKDVQRLQTLAEDDTALRVRQAALTRLGARKDKALRGFFLKVATRDESPVLRQQARAYAAELE